VRSLEGKRVLLTGASSGVGLAAARAYAAAGADVALLARGTEGLEVAAQGVRERGRRAVVLPVDVADREALEAAVERAAGELGGLDVLALNHAVTVFGPFDQVPAADFDRVIAVTFTGAVDTVRAALPHLERAHGQIVWTGSIMSRLPLPTFSSYAAAKHGMRGFLNTLRAELRAQRRPVTISMVHPGAIDTPVWKHTRSATGRALRFPPEGYTAETIADALVDCTRRPRREMIIGGEAKLIAWSFERVRPLGELALDLVYHWYMAGRRPPEPDPGALWQAGSGGETKGGLLVGRPSLMARLRLRSR